MAHLLPRLCGFQSGFCLGASEQHVLFFGFGEVANDASCSDKPVPNRFLPSSDER